jgi:N-acetylneuraminic acid mutarotase
MTRDRGACVALVVAFLMVLSPAAGQADTWFPAAPLTPTREGPTATLLPDGKVLFAGGYTALGNVDLAEVFDPASDTWAAAAPMLAGRSYQVAVLLADEDVLVVGGDETGEPHERPKTAELYDPASNTWRAISAPPELQEVQSMTVLQSGEVLLLGRFGPDSYGASRGAAVYDPASNSWRAAAAPQQTAPKQTWEGEASVLLPDGNVLFIGGDIWEDTFPPVEIHYTVLNSAEEYDPATNIWSSVAPMHQVRAQETATVLEDGDVLVTGGVNQIQTGGFGHDAVAGVELYDPQTNTWSVLAPMNVERAGHSANLLPDGDVLVAGGSDCGGGEGCLGYGGSGDCCGASSAEVYEPTTNTWTFTTAVTTGMWHTATSLPGGAVLVTGGDFAPIPMPSLDTAELYTSSYPPDEPVVSAGPLPAPAPASIPPIITDATQSHSRWREGNAIVSLARKRKLPPLGTTFSFTLNEPVSVTLTFAQSQDGKEVNHKCVAPTKKNQDRHGCKRTVMLDELSVTGHVGENQVNFQGRLSPSNKLKPGSYTLEITATDAAGHSPASTLKFTIAK